MVLSDWGLQKDQIPEKKKKRKKELLLAVIGIKRYTKSIL